LSYHIVLEDFVLLFGRTHLIHLNSNEKINWFLSQSILIYPRGDWG
jgi:hypothetical protein